LLAMSEPAPKSPATIEDEPTEVSLPTRRRVKLLENLSHELRTPLNAIIGFAHVMYDGKTGPLNAIQQESLSDILRSGQMLSSLIDEVLAPPIDDRSAELDLSDIDDSSVECALGRIECTDETPEWAELLAQER